MTTLATKLLRLGQTHEAIERFAARTPAQKHLRGLLLSMLGYVEANYCRPGNEVEAELDRWWLAIATYRRLLESPRLSARGGRELARKMLAVPWARLEKPGVVRRLLGPSARPRPARARKEASQAGRVVNRNRGSALRVAG